MIFFVVTAELTRLIFELGNIIILVVAIRSLLYKDIGINFNVYLVPKYK